MSFERVETTLPSAAGYAPLHAWILRPQGTEIRALVQISHGMAEHSARYQRFANALCAQGFMVVVHDHIGHGKSVRTVEDLGFFGETNGEQTFVKDLKTVTDWGQSFAPDVPFFLFGHGMGSLLTRNYTAAYPDLFRAVAYSGTSGSNPAIGVGIGLCNAAIALKGPKHRSKLIDKIAFGAYNKKTEQRTPCDWASRDPQEVDRYIADPLCGYSYTVSGLKAMFKTVQEISKPAWYAAIPKALPILLISGEQDPVGNYAKGVREVYDRLQKSGHTNVRLRLYPEARHEILNEINREEVQEDIIRFFAQYR